MKPFRRTLVITIMATVAISPVAAQPPPPPRPFLPFEPVQKAERDAERARRMEDRRDEYQQGARALDNREYEKAVSSFQRVIDAKSPRADGAYYWKGYALNKLGRRDEALAALGESRSNFHRAVGSTTRRHSKPRSGRPPARVFRQRARGMRISSCSPSTR